MINATEEILKLRNDKGELPSYAWPGGYPVFYVDKENNCLCPKCANENDNFNPSIVATDVNWEDRTLYCDHCNSLIESAY